MLCREPSDISMFDILSISEGNLDVPDCLKYKVEPEDINSTLVYCLDAMYEYMETYLRSIRFDVLAEADVNVKLSGVLGLIKSHIGEIQN